MKHPRLDHLHGQRLLVECLAVLCGAAAAEELKAHNAQRALHLNHMPRVKVQGLVKTKVDTARIGMSLGVPSSDCIPPPTSQPPHMIVQDDQQ